MFNKFNVLNVISIILLTIVVVFSKPVFSDSTNDNNAQTNSSGSNTQITGGYTSTTTNTYSGGQTNTTTSNTTSTTNGADVPVNSANSPSYSAMSQDVCSMGISGSVSTLGFGVSGGKHVRDLNCERIKLSKVLFDYGMKIAAVSILCQDPRVHAAMQSAGTPCPWNGKIGPDAQAMWDKYPELRPDYEDYLNQNLVNASMELNNLLDSRYPTPLPKNTQISESAASGLTSEYDALIIKATCYICASNMIRSKDPMSEQADYYYNLVTNAERTGITDRLNAGEFKLSFEVDDKDSQGSIRKITQTGTMQLVETAGKYYGEPYDVLRITCTTAGAYGVAKCKVESFGDDKLFGSETTNLTVTGGLESWGGLGGLRVRFQGAAMAEDDQWEIPVTSETRKISNASTGTISLSRKGKIL